MLTKRSGKTVEEYMADLRSAISKEGKRNADLRAQRRTNFDPAIVDALETSDAELAKLKKRLAELEEQQALERSEKFQREQLAAARNAADAVKACFAEEDKDTEALMSALMSADAVIAKMAARRADAVDSLRTVVSICSKLRRPDDYQIVAGRVRGAVARLQEALAEVRRIAKLDAERNRLSVLEHLDRLVESKQADLEAA